MRLRVLSIGAFILFMNASFLFSQLRVPIESGRSNLISKENNSKNLYLQNLNETASVDSLPRNEGKLRMKKSPAIAVLLSAVLPGAGQFYNQSYWKVPIITGLAVYFGYGYIDNNNKYKDYRDQYDATVTPENPLGDQNLKSLREFYRNQRNDFAWYFFIVYFVNLLDAYVDAHLFDFDVKEEKLTQFGKTDKTYRLKININF